MSDHAIADATDVQRALELTDWRRRIAELYASVRANPDPADAWHAWRAERERLYLGHPQSPLPREQRTADHAPRYFEYDPAWRVLADVMPHDATAVSLPASAGGDFGVRALGTVRFAAGGVALQLALHWLTDYAGGVLVSYRDSTSGTETYGAGRYLLDTAKGADLGADGGRLVLDFNFAYQPSCSYDPQWACPLPPRENWLAIPIRAGEKTTS